MNNRSRKRGNLIDKRFNRTTYQQEIRRMVWDDLSKHLKQFSSGTQIIKELKRLLMAA